MVLVFATGGIDMYKRRGRPSDIQHELKLQKFLLEFDVINLQEMFFNLFIRVSNMLVGQRFRSAVYTIFLRKKFKGS